MRLVYIAAVALAAVFASSAAVSTAGDPQPAPESDVSFVNRVTDAARNKADTKRLLRAQTKDDSVPIEAEDEARTAGFMGGFTNMFKSPALKNLPGRAKMGAKTMAFRAKNIMGRIDAVVDWRIKQAQQALKKLGGRSKGSGMEKKLKDTIKKLKNFDVRAWYKKKFM